ncbi:MAG TPA: glycoside hydrolase N-terminal domain-containing protein [Phnomibacter sp.]|nr:glycoside hydrolase N-terminal domain-containing protein [Phnomibacter sp.]
MILKHTLVWAGYIFISGFWSNAQPLTLWYKAPATQWTEALPLGNGRLGAMVFGGVETDHIQFNEETLWTGEPRNYNQQGAYQYLDSIRALLFAGRQQEAELLAGKHFMGLKSKEGNREQWLAQQLDTLAGTPAMAMPAFDDSNWPLIKVPCFDGWEAQGLEGLDGTLWFRTSFNIPHKWVNQPIQLLLNRMRHYDRTYINGTLIGSMDGEEPRQYTIPPGLLNPGFNVIAIQLINFEGKGGILGFKDTSRHIGMQPLSEPASFVSLNGQWRYFIQNDDPPPPATYQASYQPFADVKLHFEHQDPVQYKRSLNLNEAIAYTTYTSNGVQFKREYLVSAPHQAIAIHLTASKPGSVSFSASLSSAHRNYQVQQIDASTISISLQVKHGALKGVSHLHIVTQGGNVNRDQNMIKVTGATQATVYITAATNYKSYKDITANASLLNIQALRALKGISYATFRKAHLLEYKAYFNTYKINLGPSDFEHLPTNERLNQFSSVSDPAFAALYQQYGRYLLIAASRPGSRPANLQGIWNNLLAPPWGSKYTTNINAQMNYWPSEMLNLSAMHQPLFTMIKELADAGSATAREYYNAPGWVLHHNTDLWRGTAPINAANHGIWVTGGAWLCYHLWEHFQFTADTSFLQKIYPIIKGSAQFFKHFLIKDPATGYLISTPSNSPEQGGLVAGPAMDHQIIRSLFDIVIKAASILKADIQLAEDLKVKMTQIAPDKIGRYGQLQEWMQDVDDTTNKHRHISHLWAMYPGNEINVDETPALMQAAKQSLLYRGDAATGWSLGWKINCWARFKDASHTYALLQMLISPAKGGAGSYPNLFDAHPPFQIDGNFGGAAGIAEMLLQSHSRYIDLLPALPTQWSTGMVKGICARGAFEMDFSWSKGRLQSLTVRSKAGLPLHLRYEGHTLKMATRKNAVYHFNAKLQKIDK